MNISELKTLIDIQLFLDGTQRVAFYVLTKQPERYEWVQRILIRFSYHTCSRPAKKLLRQFIRKIAGYSESQLTRLIAKHKATGRIQRSEFRGKGFECRYTRNDIRLLAQTDQLHDFPNGSSLKVIMKRMYEVFSDDRYVRLATISPSHIYNLRKSFTYNLSVKRYTKTKPTPNSIGIRKKPAPNGEPGYLRVDTVHQGDLGKLKGVYHVNLVDEVSQAQVVVSVSAISENHLLPALRAAMRQFWFKIKGFHTDNGSEYINQYVAALLEKVLIEQTKSRARQTNDNALVESKNGSVIRKQFGYHHIDKIHASDLNAFNETYLNPHLNFHRPCLFAENFENKKGKIKKRYRVKNAMTPYDKFRSLEGCERYLKADQSLADLDKLAVKMTDNESAQQLQIERSKIFRRISNASSYDNSARVSPV